MNNTEIMQRIAAINAMPDDDCEIAMTLRSLLIAKGDSNDDDITCDPALGAELISLLDELRSNRFSRDYFTELAIADSLCPLHFIDWAICFDDDDPDCAQIRTIYPNSHDT